MMRTQRALTRAAVAISIAAVLSACGGHSGEILPSKPGSANPLGASAKATLTVRIPRLAAQSTRRPAYISSNTQSISFTYSIGTTQYPAQTLNVTSTSPGCSTNTNGNTLCTLTFGATAGNASYTVSAYDATDGSGNLLATAQSSLAIVAGQDNKFNVTLDGVPASINVSLTGTDTWGDIPAGTATDVGVTLSAFDADYNLIVNSPAWWSGSSAYTSATITLAPDNGEIALSQNGTPLTRTAGGYQVAAPFTGITAHYNGGLLADVAFTAALGKLTAQSTLNILPVLTEYPVPTADAGVWDIVSDAADGNVWFTESSGSRIGKITPSGIISEYPLQDATKYYYPEGIATDANGNLWIAEYGNLCACVSEMNTSGVIVKTIGAVEASCQPYPAGIAVAPTGHVWYTDNACSRIGNADPATDTVAAYPGIATPDLIHAGPDGNIWTTDRTSNLLRLDQNGNVTAFPVTANNDPWQITTGPDGNLWFTETGTSFGVLNPSTGAVKEYSFYNPNPGFAFNEWGITSGADGDLWITSNSQYFIRSDTSGNSSFVNFYGNPPTRIGPTKIVSGSDGNLWFIDQYTNAIGKISIGSANP